MENTFYETEILTLLNFLSSSVIVQWVVYCSHYNDSITAMVKISYIYASELLGLAEVNTVVMYKRNQRWLLQGMGCKPHLWCQNITFLRQVALGVRMYNQYCYFSSEDSVSLRKRTACVFIILSTFLVLWISCSMKIWCTVCLKTFLIVNLFVSFSHRSDHVWMSSSDKAVMTKHRLSTSQSSKCHICLLPSVENHYNWEQR